MALLLGMNMSLQSNPLQNFFNFSISLQITFASIIFSATFPFVLYSATPQKELNAVFAISFFFVFVDFSIPNGWKINNGHSEKYANGAKMAWHKD